MTTTEQLLRPFLRGLGAMLAPGGERARLSVLVFHRVLEAPDPMRPGEMDAIAFRGLVDLLARQFDVLPLRTAVQRLTEGRLGARSVAITFDDGYADNATVALPILAAARMPATFFVSTGFLDGGAMWNDVVIESVRRTGTPSIDLAHLGLGRASLATISERAMLAQALLRRLKALHPVERDERVVELSELMGVAPCTALMMGSEDVRKLSRAGMTIGAHTVNHPILRSIAIDEAEEEIVAGKRQLEAIVGNPIELFAYPNGQPGNDFGIEHVRIVERAGFLAAVTTAWGVATQEADLFQLPRFTPWDRHPLRFVLRMFHNYTRVHPQVVA